MSFREAIGVKIAIAVIRDLVLVSVKGGRCLEVDGLLWILDELEKYADRVIRMEIGSEALDLGRYVGEEILARRNANC